MKHTTKRISALLLALTLLLTVMSGCGSTTPAAAGATHRFPPRHEDGHAQCDEPPPRLRLTRRSSKG